MKIKNIKKMKWRNKTFGVESKIMVTLIIKKIKEKENQRISKIIKSIDIIS